MAIRRGLEVELDQWKGDYRQKPPQAPGPQFR
jgi:hypothetical protein